MALMYLEKAEEEKKKELRKQAIAKANYSRETEEAKRKAYTSFGKLILADEYSNPLWSVGKEKRFNRFFNAFTGDKDTPGPIYTPADEQTYKFQYSPKWMIGKGLRPPLYTGERFQYYDYKYNEKDDLSKIPKRWNRTVGGALSLDPKIRYDMKEKVPGPGRYSPKYNFTLPYHYTSHIGERYATLTLKNLTGTNDVVGPGKYDVEKSKYTSIHKDPPNWSIGKNKRKGLFNRVWTKHETYELYSSVGDQIRTHKRSEPKINIGKSTRTSEKIRGVFPSMMDRIPAKIHIPLPKF